MDLNKDDRRTLLDNSIERVINTAREVALHSTHENAGMSYDDMGWCKPVMVKLWNEARNAAFIIEQRDDARRLVLLQLYGALSLPFDQALPIVKRFINADFKLVFDPRVAQWCADNGDAIQADHEASNPKGKR
jgi:hypothetical protein